MVVIFLEFFALGLLMTTMPSALRCFFGDNVFLVYGIAQGIKVGSLVPVHVCV
jgi:hypothetical protein